MSPNHSLATIVCATLASSCAFFQFSPYAHYTYKFHSVCIMFQLTTLLGLLKQSFILIQTGHTGFLAGIYLGALTLPLPDIFLILCLSLVALWTRYIYEACLFDLASNVVFPYDPVFDVILFIPGIYAGCQIFDYYYNSS